MKPDAEEWAMSMFVAGVLFTCGCGARELRVRAATHTQGSLKDVHCELGGFEQPSRPFLFVNVTAPCRTTPELFVHVLKGTQPLSTVTLTETLEADRSRNVRSAAFELPQPGSWLNVSVWASCENEEKLNGGDKCRMP